MDWLEARCHERERRRRRCRSCTASTARTTSPRTTLDHLEGYRGSRPGAHRQRRLRPAPARHLRRADGLRLPLQQVRRADLATTLDELRRLLDWVCDNWQPPDEGIWEMRGGASALRLLEADVLGGRRPRRCAWPSKRSFPADRARVDAGARRDLRGIMTNGWNAKRRAFVQHYGSDALDART